VRKVLLLPDLNYQQEFISSIFTLRNTSPDPLTSIGTRPLQVAELSEVENPLPLAEGMLALSGAVAFTHAFLRC